MIGDVLLALHLLGAVLWVGGMFFALVVLRPSLSVLGVPQRIALQRQVFKRFFLVVWHAMPIVLLTGYAMLVFVYGGFGGVGWNVHVMHLLGLVMAVLFLMIFFGPYTQLRRAGDDAAPASVERIRKLVMINLALGLATVVVATLM